MACQGCQQWLHCSCWRQLVHVAQQQRQLPGSCCLAGACGWGGRVAWHVRGAGGAMETQA
jgi:hypothetical protein